MAPPATPGASSVKSHKCLNPSRRVRVTGKIRGFTQKELECLAQDSKPWISVTKKQEIGSSEKCMVFVENQSACRKDGYELDYCYEQDDDIDHIYSREIKPLVSAVFDGQNASIIAFGARGSGKTFSIQGSLEKPGLAFKAMSEILLKASELEKSVSISLYELIQDQAYDLLNPNRMVVQVLEDAQGKVNLKGLSQVKVTSISEFVNMYLSQGGSQITKKISTDESRNIKGLMVYILPKDDMLKTKKISKINFVDLAGYEDPRRNNPDGIKPAEGNRANKSLHALLNVISAINVNAIRVPYRESKLTRILQDSLGGTSHVLLLSCLNPFFCQDSVNMLNLVSRSCQSAKEVLVDSTNRIQSSVKTKVHSSVKGGKVVSTSLSLKKQVGCSQFHSVNNVEGRKLFDEGKMGNTKQDMQQSISEGTVAPVEDLSFEGSLSQSMSELQSPLPSSFLSDESAIMVEPDNYPPYDNHEEATFVSGTVPNNSSKNVKASPPLSERIREISNNLRSLLVSTPLPIEVPQKEMQSCNGEVVNYDDVMEPKTPTIESSNAYCTPRAAISNMNCTPRAAFSNYSSRVKDSFVQDYLNFLNSANKEELKSIKGIGEKRATRILQLRDESPEHFKNLDDLQDIGLSSNQVKTMMKHVAGELFN